MASKTVPAHECYFRAELDITERSSDGHRSTPFSAVARTGDPITHPFWGRIIHDLDGMKHKSRIPIDWNHSDTLVGYANRFETDTGDLVVSGALTPSKHEQPSKAEEIIDKAEMGVPYEMSITFPGEISIEEVPEGQEVEVNGRELSGPLTVVREWTLRGVAVTPYGQDANTALQFNSAAEAVVTDYQREGTMPADQLETKTTPEVDEDIKDESTVDDVANDSSEEEQQTEEQPAAESVDAETEAAEPVEAAASERVAPGREFQEAFGTVQGALYFAEGLSMSEAQNRELKRLQDEVKELKAGRKSDDLDEPSSFSQAGEIESDVLTSIPGTRVEM